MEARDTRLKCRERERVFKNYFQLKVPISDSNIDPIDLLLTAKQKQSIGSTILDNFSQTMDKASMLRCHQQIWPK